VEDVSLTRKEEEEEAVRRTAHWHRKPDERLPKMATCRYELSKTNRTDEELMKQSITVSA